MRESHSLCIDIRLNESLDSVDGRDRDRFEGEFDPVLKVYSEMNEGISLRTAELAFVLYEEIVCKSERSAKIENRRGSSQLMEWFAMRG